MTQDEKYALLIHAEIERQDGDSIATNVVRAARHAGLPLSVACALIEHETNFRNVYGHDPTIFVGGLDKGHRYRHVTRANYAIYKLRRKLTGKVQGVGPAQLTWIGYQQEAEKLGGNWNPYFNMLVGFRALASNIRAFGLVEGLHHYNGLGADASVYAQPVARAADRWHDYLLGKRKRP